MSFLSSRRRSWPVHITLGAALILAAYACSTNGSDPNSFGGNGATGGSAGSGATGGSAGASGTAGKSGSSGSSGASTDGAAGDLADSGQPDVVDEGCASVTAAATRFPLTLLVVLDESSSMGQGTGAKWTGAKAGLKAFLESPASKDIKVGLNLFPRVPAEPQGCSSMPYLMPTVDFAPLTGMTGDPQAAAILAALPANPSGVGTPIYQSLVGSLQLLQSKSQAATAAGKVENFAVLLVTDGSPEGPPDNSQCGGVQVLDPNLIEQKAAFFLMNGNVRTFVVGLQGISQTFGNALAMAGGTTSLIQVDSADVAGSFAAALADIRGDSLGCEFPLPSQVGNEYDIGDVNVQYTPGTGDVQKIGKEDPNSAAGPCGTNKGWKYDDNTTPTKIILCPTICEIVKNDPLAQISIVLGCPSEPIQ